MMDNDEGIEDVYEDVIPEDEIIEDYFGELLPILDDGIEEENENFKDYTIKTNSIMRDGFIVGMIAKKYRNMYCNDDIPIHIHNPYDISDPKYKYFRIGTRKAMALTLEEFDEDIENLINLLNV